jgi:hypothetical protein
VLLNLVNRLMAGAPAAADVAQPSMNGRMIVRYALGVGLRLWGDGILNRAAELERERAFDETDLARKEAAVARAELAALKAEIERQRNVGKSLYEEDCERAGVPLIPDHIRAEQHGCELADACVHDSRCENWPNCSTREDTEV